MSYLAIILPFNSYASDSKNIYEVIKDEEAGINSKQVIIPKIIPKNTKTKPNATGLIETAKRNNPEIKKLHQSTLSKARLYSKEDSAADGMDIALRKAAADFEKQFMRIMLGFITNTTNKERSFSNEVWSSEWMNSIIDAGGPELGEIGQAIYEELKLNMDNKKTEKKR
ncbi:MAG UNVERIFIED_CONTAM: hypothetical protein LVQ98_00345 [Rickettsiaceae bacterium]|jgi:hypothetical protein